MIEDVSERIASVQLGVSDRENGGSGDDESDARAWWVEEEEEEEEEEKEAVRMSYWMLGIR